MTAMFNKEDGDEYDTQIPTSSNNSETIIGPTVKVEGTFNSDDNILIEGQVVGTIQTSKDLTVGKDAHIEADVTAANMQVSGEIKGNLHSAGSIQLTSSARVYGDIESKIMSVETGAVVQGRCTTGEVAVNKKLEDKEEDD